MPAQPDETNDPCVIDLLATELGMPLFLTHRLDRPVSGLMLVAKSEDAQAAINAHFQQRKIVKKYWAVTEGKPDAPQGQLEHYIAKQSNGKSHVYTTAKNGAQLASLDYTCLASSDRYHLIEVTLNTGRHHQIRAQMGHIKCPIKGDVRYGARRSNPDRSIHLHARSLSFRHPFLHKSVEVIAPAPAENLWQYFEDKFFFGEKSV